MDSFAHEAGHQSGEDGQSCFDGRREGAGQFQALRLRAQKPGLGMSAAFHVPGQRSQRNMVRGNLRKSRRHLPRIQEHHRTGSGAEVGRVQEDQVVEPFIRATADQPLRGGSGDHHMALGLIGQAESSMPGGTSQAYRAEVMRWQDRAERHINRNIGYVPGTLEHLFHGRKYDRGYLSRWDMFVKHAFDPHADLKRNSFGVLEFATNKPELRHDFDLYLMSRNEDVNVAW